MSVGGLPPTRRTALELYFMGTSMIFFPRQVLGTVGGLASNPYPRGQGETGLRSTSSSLRVRGCFSRLATRIASVEGYRLRYRVTPWYFAHLYVSVLDGTSRVAGTQSPATGATGQGVH